MLNVHNVPRIEAQGREAVALANLCALAYPALTGSPMSVTQFSGAQIEEMRRVGGQLLQAAASILAS